MEIQDLNKEVLSWVMQLPDVTWQWLKQGSMRSSLVAVKSVSEKYPVGFTAISERAGLDGKLTVLIEDSICRHFVRENSVSVSSDMLRNIIESCGLYISSASSVLNNREYFYYCENVPVGMGLDVDNERRIVASLYNEWKSQHKVEVTPVKYAIFYNVAGVRKYEIIERAPITETADLEKLEHDLVISNPTASVILLSVGLV